MGSPVTGKLIARSIEVQDISVNKISNLFNIEKLSDKSCRNAHSAIELGVKNCTKRRDTTNGIVTTPVGRLRESIVHWKESGANDYVLDVIENGFKLPLKTIPEKVECKYNRSVRENIDIVWSEICKLLEKGCISETKAITHVVNPLSVAFNRSGKLH